MLTCANCQFDNPSDHKFCQRCGEPLPRPGQTALQVRLMPPDKISLTPSMHLNPEAQRYEVLTVLSQGHARIIDTDPQKRSPLQAQLPDLANADLANLKAVADLPAAAYPYFLLSNYTQTLYDAWQQSDTAVLILLEQPDIVPLVQAFTEAIDPIQPVYWMHHLASLWLGLAPVPQWRSSLLQADNLGIDMHQALRIRQFSVPVIHPPAFEDFQAFLKSLLVPPQSRSDGEPPELSEAMYSQLRPLTQAVTAANDVAGLIADLQTIGENILSDVEAPVSANSSSAVISSSSLPAMLPDSPASDLISSAPVPSPSNGVPDDDLFVSDLLDDVGMDDAEDSGELTDSDTTMVLPMKLVGLTDAGITNVGRQRDHNEDFFLIDSRLQQYASNQQRQVQGYCLYVLCDGMGGHEGGEVASELAAVTLRDYFEANWTVSASGLPDEATLVAAVKQANQAIFDVNEQETRAGHERMGTTLVMVLLQGSEAVVVHVGDSRLYQYTRRTGLKQVTVDHEVGQREMQLGIPHDIAYARPDAYQLTQALGPRGSESLVPSVSQLSFSEDTLLLLCSDGLSDNDVVETYVESHLVPILKGKVAVDKGTQALMTLANEVNGHDNISAIAVRLQISPDLSKAQS